MHDCRTNGGHFFVHRPQGHAFRCRRCSERFANSWSTSPTPSPSPSPSTPTPASASATTSAGDDADAAAPRRRKKHPWRCIIERCEYVACDPCSSILMEELAAADAGGGKEVEEGGNVGEVGGEKDGEGEEEEEEGGMMEVMEVDDEVEGEGGYEVPPLAACRTARQAAAEAAMKRAHVKRAPVRHGGRGE